MFADRYKQRYINEFNNWLNNFKYLKWINDNFENFDWKVISPKEIICKYKEINIEINSNMILISYSKNKNVNLQFSLLILDDVIYNLGLIDEDDKAILLKNRIYNYLQKLIDKRDLILNTNMNETFLNLLNNYIEINNIIVIDNKNIYDSL